MKNKDWLLFVLGLFAVSLIALPYLLLGENSYVQVHDQMDGEILNYIYQAKYMFQGDIVPEFMNGMDKASMIPPAPLGVLFYKILPPFAAFALMHWICLLTGFAGMFLLCRYWGLRVEVCFVTAGIFCYIPFYPVYGLAALGQPLLIYSFLKLRADKNKSISLAAIAFYGSMSSLTLIGYVWVVLGILCILIMFCKKQKAAAGRLGAGTAVLTFIYLITNLDLFDSLFGKGFETHRSEMVLTAAEDLLGKAKELLFVGGSYSPVYSAAILAVGILFLVIGGMMTLKKSETQKLVHCMKAVSGLLVLVFVGILLVVLWNCKQIVNVRAAIGGIAAYFQADRIYWTFPFIWMLIMAWVLEGLFECFRIGDVKTKMSAGRMDRFGKPTAVFLKYAAACLLLGLLLAEGLQVLRDNTLNKNLRLVLLEDYEQVTWESLYMEEVFAEIDEAIGADKETKSVVSLGIYPSVALYNGYICADGYSNNYELAHKHAFRKIMAEELEKSPEAKSYFDDWGNRLYLSAQPYGINGMVGKGQGTGYEDPAFDVDAMKALNIGYLFSAASIEFSEDIAESFELLPGSPYSDEESYYEVWVYRIR